MAVLGGGSFRTLLVGACFFGQVHDFEAQYRGHGPSLMFKVMLRTRLPALLTAADHGG